jgi:hypothetical protein
MAPEPFEYNARLLKAEKAIHDFRRRLWFALIGYLLLLAGLVVAFVIVWDQRNDLKDTQRETVQSICKAAVVIRTQPDEVPSIGEGEDEQEFAQRIKAAAVFLRDAEPLCDAETLKEIREEEG